MQEVTWVHETTLPGLERSREHLDGRGHAQLLTDDDAFNNGPTLLRRLLGLECNSSEHEGMDMHTTHDVERIGDQRGVNTLYTIRDPGAVTEGSLRSVRGLIVCSNQLRGRTT